MATSGIAKSWVKPAGTTGAGAYYSWEWTSEIISPGVTRVYWSLYGKGRSSGPNWLQNECYIYATYNGSTKTIYSLPWTSTGDMSNANNGKNNSFNPTQANSYRTSESFDVTHNANGTASFTIKITASMVNGAGTGGTTTTTFNLDTNAGGLVKIYDGSTWRNAIPYIYDGTSWRQCIPYVYDGSSWKIASG